MPDKILQRLDSYQSGGSVGGSSHGGGRRRSSSAHDGDCGRPAPPPPPSSLGPRLLAQFSLIGQVDEEDGDAVVILENGSAGDPSRLWAGFRYWFRTVHRRSLAVAIVVLCIVLVGLTSVLHRKPSTASPSEHMMCPIQSSYTISSDVMDLKNTSAVENVENGAVATDHPACSRIGVDILKRGGNAADAAVASAFCLGVVSPTSSGMGGGAFILVHSTPSSSSDGVVSPPFEDARSDDSGSNDDTRRRRTAANGHQPRQHPPSQRRKVAEFIDCRETAPAGSTYDMFEPPMRREPPDADSTLSSTLGGLAVAVPGELRGLELLHHRHGSLPWADLVMPSVVLARDGFEVETHLAKAIREKERYIQSMPGLGHALTKDNDGVTPLEEGDIMVRGQYAQTLEAIMHGGSDALYKGDLSKMLAKDIQDAGGIITPDDLEGYRPVLRDPLISRVAGYTVVGAPPPSSGGGAIIGALRFLAGFATPYSALYDTLSQHRFVEACRHVFAIRMSLSDPRFFPGVNADAVRDLIEGDYMDELRGKTLDDAVLSLSEYGGAKWAQLEDVDGKGELVDAQEGDRRQRRHARGFNYLNDHGTTSLSVVDGERNSVTITSSINLEFGSKVVSPSTGIILNNQMDDFSSPGRVNFFGIHPSESNYAAPGKRPLSSMAPTMVFWDGNDDGSDGPGKTATDSLGKLVLSLGASGGPKIITGVLRTILNHAIVGMPLYESVSAPRVHNQLLYHGAAASNVEEVDLPQGPAVRLSNRTRHALTRRGHDLIASDYFGAVQAVAVDLETDLLSAVADIRKQGMPAGY